ncbi:MAG: peptidyl-tRNA hydrolase [bacterium]|nr:peptidyl-tRNA hydrolase [bacterium]
MTQLRLVVGLGNPGAEYAAHRHNVGFGVVGEVARRLGVDFTVGGSGTWAVAAAEPLVLVKPLTYMNRSGEALTAWARAAGVRLDARPETPPADPLDEVPPPEPGLRPLVVCDDLALPLGSLRLRPRGSSGGQNGLGDIIDELGGEEFPRLRLGIAPLAGDLDPAVWPDFVLESFAPEEREEAADLVVRAADAVENWAVQGLSDTVNRYNRRVRRPAED